MDIDNVVKNLKQLSFEEVEHHSQQCSKQIVFDRLEKNINPSSHYFKQCENILAEYRQRLHERVKKDSGIDLQHKLETTKE